MDDLCNCEQPFILYPFPTVKKNNVAREKWIKLINRKQSKTSNHFIEPSKDARVCSKHFIDGKRTEANPLPTKYLGYDSTSKIELLSSVHPSSSRKRKPTSKAILVQESCPSKKRSLTKKEGNNEKLITDPKINTDDKSIAEVEEIVDFNTQTYPAIFKNQGSAINQGKQHHIPTAIVQLFLDVVFQLNYVDSIVKIVVPLIISCNSESESQEIDTQEISTPSLWPTYLSDKNCKFYTNIGSLTLLEKIHNIIAPHIKRRYSSTPPSRHFNKTPTKMGPSRKLSTQDEFLLVMMKLRLGLLTHDLADRFNIATSTVGKMFTSWIKGMAACLKPMIFIPDQGVINATSPSRYNKYKNLTAIIDCSEVFIETPSDKKLQSATWSNYKHHNTLKFLVAVAPNSAIVFVSQFYTGRISDKKLTIDSKFLDAISPYCTIMADKGFDLFDECTARRINFVVPPGRRGTVQMTPGDICKTSLIAKTRILVEQVIRRIKTFRILGNELQLTMLSNADDILFSCCALCNLMEPMYKD